jgi:hypothetical protein
VQHSNLPWNKHCAPQKRAALNVVGASEQMQQQSRSSPKLRPVLLVCRTLLRRHLAERVARGLGMGLPCLELGRSSVPVGTTLYGAMGEMERLLGTQGCPPRSAAEYAHLAAEDAGVGCRGPGSPPRLPGLAAWASPMWSICVELLGATAVGEGGLPGGIAAAAWLTKAPAMKKHRRKNQHAPFHPFSLLGNSPPNISICSAYFIDPWIDPRAGPVCRTSSRSGSSPRQGRSRRTR